MSSTVTRFALAVAIGAMVVPASRLSSQESQTDVQALVAAARQALGGEANLANIKSFTIEARTRSLRYATASTHWTAFKIAAEFPDKFVRATDGGYGGPRVPLSQSPDSAGGYLTSSGAGSMALGFNGDHVIADGVYSSDDYRNLDGTWRPFVYPQSELDEKYLERARIGALPWMLGMFAEPMPGVPVQLEASTSADAATTVIVTGGGLQRPRTLAFDPVSHLPASLDGMTFEDYRQVGPVIVPFRMKTNLVEEDVTSIHLNVKIDAKRFRPSGR
jgi:hypothetical protein